jgi:hypothetical protein
MKRDAEFFSGKEAVLVFIAKKLKDALKLEAAFDSAGLDYGVETDEYKGGVVFQSVRVGAFFYVLPESVEAAHETIRAAGFNPHVEPPAAG